MQGNLDPLTIDELRAWLAEAGIDVHESVALRLLTSLQPMSATLRAADAAKRERMLRGALNAAKRASSPARPLVGSASADGSPDQSKAGWWLGCVGRLVALQIAGMAVYVGLAAFAYAGPATGIIILAIAAVIAVAAITGWGLGTNRGSGGVMRALGITVLALWFLGLFALDVRFFLEYVNGSLPKHHNLPNYYRPLYRLPFELLFIVFVVYWAWQRRRSTAAPRGITVANSDGSTVKARTWRWPRP